MRLNFINSYFFVLSLSFFKFLSSNKAENEKTDFINMNMILENQIEYFK